MFGRARRWCRSPRRRTPRAARPRCPSASWYGAYCTKQLMMCLPGGAMRGSTRVGMIMSMYGRSAEAAGLGVVVGLLHVVERRAEADRAAEVLAGARAGSVKSGSPSSARLTLPDEPRNRNRRTSCSKSGSSVPGSSRSRKVTLASVGREDRGRLDLLAGLEHDAGRAAVADRDAGDRRLGPDLRAERCGRARDRLADAARAAARDAPGAERAVDLAHVVVQQHVRRARRADALERADDAGRGHRRLERVGLEPLVEEVRRRSSSSAGRTPSAGAAAAARSARAGPPSGSASRGSGSVGSSGTMPRMGLMKRAISTISRPYSLVRLGVGWRTSGAARAPSGRGRRCATGSRRRGA